MFPWKHIHFNWVYPETKSAAIDYDRSGLLPKCKKKRYKIASFIRFEEKHIMLEGEEHRMIFHFKVSVTPLAGKRWNTLSRSDGGYRVCEGRTSFLIIILESPVLVTENGSMTRAVSRKRTRYGPYHARISPLDLVQFCRWRLFVSFVHVFIPDVRTGKYDATTGD